MKNNSLQKIQDKINSCDCGKFIKIDENKLIDMSIGKNLQGKYCFIIRGKSIRRKVDSSDIVSLELQMVNKNEKQLVFTLNNDDFTEMFIKLIEDIFNILHDNKEIIDKAYKRWWQWKELFSNHKKFLLNEQKIRGLLGELLFLKNYMLKNHDIEDSILSWGGADFNRKDFEVNNMWFEIKTSLGYKNEIVISSLSQLSSDYEGYLILYSLDKSTAVNNSSISLNRLIDHISKKIINPNTYDIFIRKLEQQGYFYDKKYDEYCYMVSETRAYIVDDRFPRLTNKSVPNGVVECKYSIDISFIEENRII